MTKMILGAIALAFAVPAMAQTAPATDPHAGHGQQQPVDHGKHDGAKHDCKQCCEQMKGKHGKMECMDKKAEAKPAPADQHDHSAH